MYRQKCFVFLQKRGALLKKEVLPDQKRETFRKIDITLPQKDITFP
jgi:hypothetical protein